MPDFYHQHYKEYQQKTFSVDMSSVLMPLVRRLDSDAWILDAGCGSGRDLLWLKQQGFHHITGFERSPGLAELTRQHVGCQVISGDFESYDFSEFSADAVLLMGSLVHIPHERFVSVFQNIIQALKSDGYVLISLKQGTGKRTDGFGRVFYLWQDDMLRKLFYDNGFHVADFSRQVSRLGTDEVWLAYVLSKRA